MYLVKVNNQHNKQIGRAGGNVSEKSNRMEIIREEEEDKSVQ